MCDQRLCVPFIITIADKVLQCGGLYAMTRVKLLNNQR